jgi:hypothetical protein
MAGMAQQSGTDVIYLKNGTVVRGKIVDQVPNVSIKVYTTNRTMVEFKMDEVERTAKEAPASTDVAAGVSDSPTSSGNMIIFGNMNFDYQKSTSTSPFSPPTTYKRTQIGIYPGIDFFVADNLAVGASAALGFNFSKGSTTTTIGLGPEVRYYFDMGLLLKLETSFVHSANKSYKDNYLVLKPGIGYAIFLNNKVALEPCLIYEMYRDKEKYTSGNEYTYKSGRFGLEVGLTIFL